MIIPAPLSTTANLYEVRRNSFLKVIVISGDYGIRRYFNQLGIHSGDRLRVLRRAPFGGPLVVDNCGVQVAISKQLAQKVHVELLP